MERMTRKRRNKNIHKNKNNMTKKNKKMRNERRRMNISYKRVKGIEMEEDVEERQSLALDKELREIN